MRTSQHPLARRIRNLVVLLGFWPTDYPPWQMLAPLFNAMRLGCGQPVDGTKRRVCYPRNRILRLRFQGKSPKCIGTQVKIDYRLVEQILIWENVW